MVSAGRVLLMPKGEYNAATAYTMLDLVSYNGSSYIAKKSTTGNLPTNTEYWQLSAYGGSAANLAGNFATLETTDYASQEYAIDDFLVTKDSVFCKVIAAIDIGDELVLDTNIEATSVSELIQAIIDYVAGLDAKDVKLQGMTAISAQTDLDDMTTPGNFYKSSTSFYVTNAPTGIASELTAIFRLTVENGSDTTDKYIQTLRTNDGKTYTRGYDGSDWSDWIEDASAASVSALDSAKQPKTLATPITVDGVQQTTNEGALGAINTLAGNTKTGLANEAATRSAMGAKNLLPNEAVSGTIAGVTFTKNADGSITVNGTATETIYYRLFMIVKGHADQWIPKSLMPFVGCKMSGSIGGSISPETYFIYIDYSNDDTTWGGSIRSYDGETIIPDKNYYQNSVNIFISSGTSMNNVTFYPMIRLATDSDDTYEPYALTNQQLTPYALSQSNPNLLDNPFFTVNQRGNALYSANGYCVDRWYNLNADIAVVDGGVTLTKRSGAQYDPLIRQLIIPTKDLVGKTVTLSVKVTALTGTGVIYAKKSNGINSGMVNVVSKDITETGITKVTFTVPSDAGGSTYPYIMVGVDLRTADGTMTIEAIKLEVGSVSTLALDTAPNYQQELAKCQRYFQRIRAYGKWSQLGVAYGNGVTDGVGAFATVISLAVPMRARPSLTYGGNLRTVDFNGNDSEPITGLTFQQICTTSVLISGTATGTELVVGAIRTLSANNDATAHIDLSADL